MKTNELRVDKLRTKKALDFYRDVVYPRHLNSFPLFGIEAHGFWTAMADVQPRLFVLVSSAAGDTGRSYPTLGINFLLNPVGAPTGFGIPIHDPRRLSIYVD